VRVPDCAWAFKPSFPSRSSDHLHRQPLQDSDDEVYVIAMPNKKNQLPRQQHGKNMRREEQEEIASSWVIIH
jgi:hypothetical protein